LQKSKFKGEKMAKILIAGLGKGFEDKETKEWKYSSANYRIEGEEKVYEKRNFITSALEEHFKIDKTIYIGTTGSMWNKLYEHYYNGKIIKEEDKNYRDLLLNITKTATKDSKIEEFPIDKFNEDFYNRAEGIITKYGMNTQEIYEIFNNIIKRINLLIKNSNDKKHEIYLDITHSFRSNAMWMFLVINYLTDVLSENVKIEIKMISYGMFEARENGITPIVNLKSFYDLMKWIKGANAFKQYGNTYEFLDMIEDDRLRNTLEEFSNSMNMNYIWNIKENIGKINKIEETIKTLDGPAELLLPDILERFVENFGKRQETFEMLLSLAEWHYNQKRYSMSFVNIIEAIYTFVGKILEIEDINNKAKERIREWIDEISEENKMNYKNLLEEEINNRIELREIFETFRVIRNSISHTLENKSEMQEIISKIPQNIEKLRKIFEMEYKKNGIAKPKDLNLNQTYTLLENLAEEGEFKEVGRIASNGIYDFLFKTLNVEKSSENKNFVKNWLDSKKENFGKRIEKEQLSELMKVFLEIKNNRRSITEKEMIKKVRHLKNIIINKTFIEAFENINLSNKANCKLKKEIKIDTDKGNRKILIFKDSLDEEQKKELITKFKISKISKLTIEVAKEWQNLKSDKNKETNIKRFKEIIEKNIDFGDVLLINGEIGITFEIVNWAKEKGIIVIYEVLKEPNDSSSKVELQEY
jgi:CRISPR-associated protein, TM1812 family